MIETHEHAGFISLNGFSPSGTDKTAIVNLMISLAPGASSSYLGHFVNRYNNNFGTLPGPAVLALNGTGTKITIGSGLYSYLFATYSDDRGETITGDVWYIGNLSGDITIPGTLPNGFGHLSGWTLFGPGVPGVPDGGTTVMLLGTALGALGMARRFLKA